MASNPYANKVTFNGVDLIDLTSDTATQADVVEGATFHLASGAQVVGTAHIPTALSELTDDSTHRLVTDTEKSTWNAKYTKASSGIPKSDLASDVRTTLTNADDQLLTSAEISNFNSRLGIS